MGLQIQKVLLSYYCQFKMMNSFNVSSINFHAVFFDLKSIKYTVQRKNDY